MWKYFIAVSVVLGLTFYVAGQNKDASENREQPTAQSSQAAISEETYQEQSKNDANKPGGHSPGWFRLFTWPDGTTAWAIILTLIAIAEQARESAKAARAGEDAARAALVNAQAVINAERAWLTVSIDDGVSSIHSLPEGHYRNERRQLRRITAKLGASVEFGDEDDSGMCFVVVQNQGRTPAKVIAGSSSHCFVDRPDNLSIPPDYSKPIFLPDPTFIVNGDSFKIRPGFKPEFILEQDGKQGAIGGAMEFLICYGRVIYEDVFAAPDGSSGTHETRWCFVYRPSNENLFATCGPDEYSGHKENKPKKAN